MSSKFYDAISNSSIIKASLGKDALDIRDIAKQGCHEKIFYSPGFADIASCKSSIAFIDGLKGILLYRGYPIQDLVGNADYIEIIYLLFFGNLPNQQEYDDFYNELDTRSKKFPMKKISITGSPMHDLSSAFNSIAGMKYCKNEFIFNYENIYDDAMDILAYTPIIVYHIMNNISDVTEIGYLDWYCEHSFKTLNDSTGYDIDSLFHDILIIHAEHEQNASTSTVRSVASTHADPYMSIVSGIAALSGPLHGKANINAVEMLMNIGSKDKIDDYIARVKNKECLIYGFGHRVYKMFDPRSTILLQHYNAVKAHTNPKDAYLFDIAHHLHEKLMQDDYFQSRNLYPNVDFYSGLIFRALGIDNKYFTMMFAFGRIAGWLAHIIEMCNDKEYKIFRPAQIYQGHNKRAFIAMQDR